MLPVRQDKTLVEIIYIKFSGCVQLAVECVQSQLPSVTKKSKQVASKIFFLSL